MPESEREIRARIERLKMLLAQLDNENDRMTVLFREHFERLAEHLETAEPEIVH